MLASAGRPLTIPEILDAQPGLAQSSAYRNLQLLEHAGVVHRIVTNAEFARYELAEDLTGDHHHHLICTICGSVEDVPASAGLEQSVHDAMDQIRAQHGVPHRGPPRRSRRGVPRLRVSAGAQRAEDDAPVPGSGSV